MGLFNAFRKLGGVLLPKSSHRPGLFRRCRFEEIEPRRMMAAQPLHLGSVYLENGQGNDAQHDLISITFKGGADGSQLRSVTINTDKGGNGLSAGDLFFDTAPGGLGAKGSSPAVLVANEGVEDVRIDVADGGMLMTLTFVGFEAGDRVTIGVDVDEQQSEIDGDTNAVVEGREFQFSVLSGQFTAPRYFDIAASDRFVDDYDPKLVGLGLDLPADDYGTGTEEGTVPTAGAVATVVQQPRPGSLAGVVFVDLEADNAQQADDAGLAGVELALYRREGGAFVDTLRRTQTDADGHYRFDNLAEGEYRVVETQPAGYLDVGAKAGTVEGGVRGRVESDNAITEVTIGADEHSLRNDFAETLPVRLSGNVFHDLNNNGLLEAGEPGIPGARVRVERTSAGRPQVFEIVTAADGSWATGDMLPGVYRATEVQPADYNDGLDAAGSAGGTVQNDLIAAINLPAGTSGTDYNFGEIRPARLCGGVYVDANRNGALDAGETPIAGVAVQLFRDGQLVATAVTGDSGRYCFRDLLPGEYTVVETQPAGYLDGADLPGTAGGEAGDDSIGRIVLVSGLAASEYNFLEVRPASLSGHVYVDANDNGLRDAGEAGIAGVSIALLRDGQPTGQTAVTDAAGYYEFADLLPGVYSLVETQPAGYLDNPDTAGSVGGLAENPGDFIGQIVLAAGDAAVDYDFGEIPPASIGGRVHGELDMDCQVDDFEPRLEGVTVYLLDAAGTRIGSTTTDAEGYYRFDGLRPGLYGIEEIQPAGYLDGPDHPGTHGGRVDRNDLIAGVALPAGAAAVHYDFCELVPASISGYVFQDGPAIEIEQGQPHPDPWTVSDGQFTPDDTPLEGVRIILADADGQAILGEDGQPLSQLTDASGYFEFAMLRPGVYTLLQEHPEGYDDGLDTAGSRGGAAINGNVDNTAVLARLVVDPRNDAIAGIELRPADAAVQYLFSELLVLEIPPQLIPDDPPYLPDPIPDWQPLVPPSPLMVDPPIRVAAGLPQLSYVSPFQLLLSGGGGVPPRGWTWHLSVVNGGQPRRNADSTMTADAAPGRFTTVNWSGETMRGSTFTLLDGQGKLLKKVVFGTRGAIPVTGDWNGDGLWDVGVFVAGEWFLDLDGDGQWDSGDLWARLGSDEDRPVAGDWDGDGKIDIGIYGPQWSGDERALQHEPGQPDVQNQLQTARYKNMPPRPEEATSGYRTMKQTAEGRLRADLIDHVFRYGGPQDRAVAGDWNGDGIASVGVYRAGTWYLDVNGDGRWGPGDAVAQFGQVGDKPLAGDFNGDGVDDIAVYRDGVFYLDSNGNRILDGEDKVIQGGGPNDMPVAGDFDGDGADEVGFYSEGQAEAAPSQAATERLTR